MAVVKHSFLEGVYHTDNSTRGDDIHLHSFVARVKWIFEHQEHIKTHTDVEHDAQLGEKFKTVYIGRFKVFDCINFISECPRTLTVLCLSSLEYVFVDHVMECIETILRQVQTISE